MIVYKGCFLQSRDGRDFHLVHCTSTFQRTIKMSSGNSIIWSPAPYHILRYETADGISMNSTLSNLSVMVRCSVARYSNPSSLA